MKNHLLRIITILLPLQFTFAQLFIHSPENLPVNGATGQSMDIQAADLDGDGDLDLVLANEFQRNNILLNDGQGQFTNPNSIPNVIHDSEDVAIADYDQDGDLDLIFCSEDDVIHEYYLNDGTASFSSHPDFQFPNSTANAVLTADLNGDNIPDVLFGNAGQDRIFINLGDGTFEDATAERLPVSSETTQDLHLCDIDQDSDLDLLVGNEGNCKILINDSNGVFTDDTADRLPIHPNVETRKIASGDINDDGAPDLFYSNVAFLSSSGPYRSNILFLNDGSGHFTDISTEGLPENSDDTLDAIFEDVDGDGDLDLVIANVNLQSAANQQVFINNGAGIFTDQTTEVLGNLFFHNALGVIAADLNNDGLRDLYFCERNLGNGVKDLFFIKSIFNAVDSDSKNAANNISLFPNPAVDSFTIEWSSLLADPTSLELFDPTSRKISDLECSRIDAHHIQVIIPSWIPSGPYFLHIVFKEQVITQPLNITN